MTLHAAILESFERSFSLYSSLVEAMEESELRRRLGDLRSNSIGLQLWCVVGARESYSRAIQENRWKGFSCSLEHPDRKLDVLASLAESANQVLDVCRHADDFSAVQCRLWVDLLEHEAAHQGQLIRYIYALGLPIPDNWRARFALKD